MPANIIIVSKIEMMKEKLSSEAKKEYEEKIATLESYLPEQLSAEKVIEIIDDIIDNLKIEKTVKNMGIIMKAAKEKIGDAFDSKSLSELIRLKLK